MPMRPNLLASRKTRSSIAKHSGHFDISKCHGSLQWGLFERQRGPDTCVRSVSRFEHGSLPDITSPYTPLMTSQPKRNFSNTTRKEGIWDDDDEVPEPKPVQRIPGRPAFVRPAINRDLGSLIRSRVDGKKRVSQRLHIEKQFNSLPSHHELVESFIQLKYKQVDDLLDECIKANATYEAEYGALSSILQKQINDAISRITNEVVHSEKTIQRCVTEWESLSNIISTRLVTIVSDTTYSVLQAEKITQKYIAEVIHLSSSILGLNQLQATVTKAENTGRMLDHDFCCIAFAKTPEWERKLEISAQTIRGWQKSLRAAQKTLLEPLVNLSELSICQLRDTLNDDYLRPRDTARSRIDRVLHQSELIRNNYKELRLKTINTHIFPVRDLCWDLQSRSSLCPADKSVFGQYMEILEQSWRDIRMSAHHHRSFWLRRQMAVHPLRQSELWNLADVMAAAASARHPKATDKRILLAFALGTPKDSPASQYVNQSPLIVSNQIYHEYKRLWMPKPARSPELHIYWRQLDVMAPLLMSSVIDWRLQTEVWYLHYSLRGDLGELWAGVPPETLRQTVSKIADWAIEFQKRRTVFRELISDYTHLNWLRLQSETLLHGMGEPIYLAGKFEVLNPMSQDIRRFKEWADRIGKVTFDAHISSIASRPTKGEWDEIQSEIKRKIGQGTFANTQFLELGSSVKKPRRKRGREDPESPTAKASFIKISRSRVTRYIKKKLSGHSESPPSSQGDQEPGRVVVRLNRSLVRSRRKEKKRVALQCQADLAASQGKQEENHGDKLSPSPSTIKAEDHTTEGNPVSKVFAFHAPTGQDKDKDKDKDSQVIYKPPSKLWKSKPRNLGAPEFSPFLVNAPAGQDKDKDSQVIYKPPSKLWKSKPRSLGASEINPFLVNAPASQTDQDESQVLPNPPPILSKSKEVSLSTDPNFMEPQLGDLRPPIPRGTSNSFPGTRTHNGVRPAVMLPRKPFAKPEQNHGRKYSTDAIFYQTKCLQSGGVSDDSLPGRPLETHISSVPDTTNGHGPGCVEEIDSTHEPTPSLDTGSNPNNLTTPRFWSHSSQQSPDGRKLIVHYCRTLQSTEEAVQHFLGSKVIGFDMEWKAQASGWDSIQSNVSVIQIANEERIAIFQVALFKPARSLDDLVSPSLKRLIESPDIMKVGVSIKADCTRLRKYLGIDARATFELSHLYKLIKYGKDNPKLVNKRGVNLSEQINEHFGLPLEKSDDVRCGDWTRALSYRQVQYAATDPYACVRLFHIMEAKRKAIDPVPPRPAYAELNQPIVLPLGQAVNSEEDPLI